MFNVKYLIFVWAIIGMVSYGNAQTVSDSKKETEITFVIDGLSDSKSANDLKEELIRNFDGKVQSIEIDSTLTQFQITFYEYYNTTEILEYLLSLNHNSYYIKGNKGFKLSDNGLWIQEFVLETSK